MEAKFLARIFSILSIFLAISVQADELDSETEPEIEYDSAIYYGDSNVNLGDPFRITCIIPISDPIHWTKDGESITRHNLRHGRDDHSFLVTETAIEGENDKIEAHLTVKHALKVHEGKYQCNSLHTSYHILRVRSASPSVSVYKKPPHIEIDSRQTLPHHPQPPLPPYTTETNAPTPTRDWSSPSSTDLFTKNWHQMPSSTTKLMPSNIYNNRTPNFAIDFSQPPHSTVSEYETEFDTRTGSDPESQTMTISSTKSGGHYDYEEALGRHHTHTHSPTHYTPTYPDYIPRPTANANANAYQTNQYKKITYFTPSPPQIPPTEFPPYPPPTTFLVASSPKPIKRDDLLVPNYDNAEHQLKTFFIKQPLVLSCNVTKEGNYELLWKKNGTDVTQIKELNNRHKILKAERKFIIEKTDISDAGNYTCEANDEKKDIHVVASVAVRITSNVGVVEGEKLTLHCEAFGTDVEIHWEIGNQTVSASTEKYILKADEHDIKNAILIVENVSLADKGDYKCVANNLGTKYAGNKQAEDVSLVRVKGKLAALWPFLGICAEVLILCTIILIYEKRRNKSDVDESDTDPNEQKKKRRNNYD